MIRSAAFLALILFSAAPATAQEKMLKVVTWNIEYGKNYEEILAGLRELDADVYLFQEVDLRTKRVGGRNVAEDLAKELGYDFLWSQEFRELKQEIGGQPAFTGQAILARTELQLKLIAEGVFERQAAKWTPSVFHPRSWTRPRYGGRSWQCAEILWKENRIAICNTHLESSVADEKLLPQMKELLDYISSNFDDFPTIIAGDLNISKGANSPLIGLAEAAGFTDVFRPFFDRRDYPSTRPHKRATNDWILVNDRFATTSTKIGNCDGSDHCPVIVELGLRN